MSYLNHFHYQILGKATERTPMVFLHGLMGYALNWKKIALAFENQTQVLIFDQRGHGKSFHPKQGYAPENYAEDLSLILQELGWKKIDLIGHSMGGRNALHFAHQFPQCVRRLVIEDIGPEVEPGSTERIQNLINLVPAPFPTKLAAKDFFMNQFPKLIAKNPHANTLGQYFYSNMIEKPDGLIDWRFSKNAILDSLHEGRTQNRWHEWEHLNMPTLIIRGENSEDLSPSLFQKMRQKNPKSQGVVIQKAGHWVHFDQPEIFIQVLRYFLEASEDEIFRLDFDFPGTSS